MADIKNHSTLPTSLVACWDLQEPSTGASAVPRYDLVGSRDLTDNGTTASIAGKIGNGADFDGSASYLNRSAATLGIADAWSISLWASCDNVAAAPRVLQFGSGSFDTSSITILFQNISTGYFYVDIKGASGSTRKIYKFLPTDITALTHYVVTWDGTNLKLYENGVEESSPTKDDDDTMTMTDSSRTINIGSTNSGTAILNGTVDEVLYWAKELTSTEVADLYNSGDGLEYYKPDDIANDTDLTTNLVAYWELEEAAGADDRVDSYSTNDLVAYNTPGASVSGKQGGCLDLDRATSEYLQVPDNAALSMTGDISFSLWVKPETLPGDQWFIAKGDIAATRTISYYLYTNGTGGGIEARMSDDGSVNSGHNILWQSASGLLSTGTWAHIVFTFDASAGTGVLYVDGSIVSTTPTGTMGTTVYDSIDDFYLGARESGGSPSSNFDGLIDESAVYSKVLTVGEVRALYGYTSPPVYSAAGVTANNSARRMHLMMM